MNKKNLAKCLGLVALAIAAQPASAEEKVTKELVTKHFGDGPVEWGKYLQDSAAGSVSAASMLSIDGDSITTVENVRDVVVALKGLGDSESKATVAIAITPARSTLAPMSYVTYATGGLPAQALGSFTIGYAQGELDIAGAKYERRAASAETSVFFDPERDDPVIAFATRLAKYGVEGDESGKKRDVCDTERDDRVKAARAASGGDITAPGDPDPTRPNNTQLSSGNAMAKAQQAVRNECYKQVIDDLRWNRSRASIAYATGWIKGTAAGSDEESLGQTIAASVSYGWGESWLLSLTYRHSMDEPVLDTLGTAAIKEKDTELIVGQVKYGNKKIRALVELSDADTDEVTASQRTFRQAVGLDFRVYDAMWLNFRYGRQKEIDGDGNENGSLLTISYSPSALLQ